MLLTTYPLISSYTHNGDGTLRHTSDIFLALPPTHWILRPNFYALLGTQIDMANFRLVWPCILNVGWRERKQDAANLMFIIKLLSQHVSGIIMHQENKSVNCRIWCSALVVMAVVVWSWDASCVNCEGDCLNYFGTWRFIAAFTTTPHVSLSWTRPIQSMSHILLIEDPFL